MPCDVIFVARDDFIEDFRVNANLQGISIIASVTSIEKAIELLKEHEEAVFVIDSTSLTDNETNKFLSYIHNDRYILAIAQSAKHGFQLLNLGATDMLVKPGVFDLRQFMNSMTIRIRNIKNKFNEKNVRQLKNTSIKASEKIIAIGSSTGGTEAVFEIMKNLPEIIPPILLVQHMPPVFTKLYAERLQSACKVSVWEARDGDLLKPGLALVAPGENQMRLIKKNDEFAVDIRPGEKVNGHCPSVDVLFNSVAEIAGNRAIGVILTGMGSDGAIGLLNMRKRGAATLGQDKESCVVYGMPKVAFDKGAVERQVALADMAQAIMSLV